MTKFSVRSGAGAALFAVLSGCASPAAGPITSAAARTAATPAKHAGHKDLYVADYGSGTIFLFKNHDYTPDGTITTGVSGPWGVTLDRSGNLYVANAAGANVTEYAPGTSTPSFTYSYGMNSPRLVSVDRQGNVFVSDFTDDYTSGRVSEFPQGSNYPMYSCSGAAPWDIATDASGDVFVSYNVRNAGSGIEEFKGGLAGCSPTTLSVHVDSAMGMVLDRQNNILVADYYADRIDVIPPPYTAIARHLNTDRRGPTFISIDKANSKVFATVSGFWHSYVVVLDYPSGKFKHRLGYGRGGFTSPYGTVDTPNAVQ